MKVSRYLRKTKATDGKEVIELSMTWHFRRVRWSSGLRISPKMWDKNRQRVKNSGDSTAIGYNDELDKQEKLAVAILQGYLQRDILPEASDIKQEIDIALNRVKVAPMEEKGAKKEEYDLATVEGYWRKFIEDNVNRYSKTYIDIHWAALRQFVAFKEGVLWQDVNQRLVEDYANAMIEDELANSTISAYLSKLAKLVGLLREEGVFVPVNMRNVYIDKHSCIPVFLTMPEVRKIMSTTYSSENLQVVADGFVFAIASGVRFSDLIRISDAEVTLDRSSDGVTGYIQLLQKKTSLPLVVTMTDLAVEMWMKYNGNPLSSYMSLTGKAMIGKTMYRKLLQKVGKEAGIDEVIVKRWKVGNEWREERGPKWQFLASHVARHTHAMIGLELGIPIEIIQKGLGHSSIVSTMRYARIAEGKASEQIKDKWKNFKV